LRGVVAQKLIPAQEGDKRYPNTEILIMTPYTRQLVSEGKLSEVYSIMARSGNEGMMTFDQDLLRLCREGKITQDVAMEEAARPDNFVSMLQGISVKL